jgi:AcrR family transcriptional regulator
MPKPLTENEREYIKSRLIEEAQNCLKQYGMRKTTVDELVKRVNIPKGTFYLFYDSKELLFFDVFRAFHDEMHAYLKLKMEALPIPVTAVAVTDLIFNVYQKVEESFLYRFIIDGDIELLMRKLPPEVTQEHTEIDNFSIQQLLAVVPMAPGINDENSEIFGAALRAIFLTMLHKQEIGSNQFGDTLKLMIRGIVIQMFEERIK